MGSSVVDSSPSGPTPARDRRGRAEADARAFEEWVRSHSTPGDELWYYDTGGDTWENLCGEDGFAIVRQGQVSEFWVYAEN